MIVDLTADFQHWCDQNRQASTKGDLKDHQSRQSLELRIHSKYSENLHTDLKWVLQTMESAKDNYFSNAAYSYTAFTDKQRNQFDASIKQALETLNRKINEMKETVDKSMFGNTTQKQHLSSVVLCLYQMFTAISAQFKKYLEFNERRKQKALKTLAMEVKPVSKQESKVITEKPPTQIDEELEHESRIFVLEKTSEQNKLNDTNKTLESISEALSLMSNKVLEQELLSSSFKDIGQTGLYYIDRGNTNLIEANMLSKESGKYWSMLFILLALSLLVLDWFKS